MKRTLRLLVGALALGGLASGCAFLRPLPEQTKYFVLTPLAPLAPAGSKLRIGVGPFIFPDYLGRPQIARRKTPNQVRYTPDRYWAEPLEQNFARALSENLGLLLGTERVVILPFLRRVELDAEVAVEVLRFEPTHENEVVLVARWAVRAGSDRHHVATQESRIHEPLDGTTGNAWARAMSRATLRLSQEIATELQGLP